MISGGYVTRWGKQFQQDSLAVLCLCVDDIGYFWGEHRSAAQPAQRGAFERSHSDVDNNRAQKVVELPHGENVWIT